jgi:hypothetical protein
MGIIGYQQGVVGDRRTMIASVWSLEGSGVQKPFISIL